MASKSSLIEGLVLDARGHPVAGARISWARAPVPVPDMALLTDPNGRFALAAPAPGRYTLRCDSDQQGSAEEQVQATGQALQVTLKLKR